MSSANDDTKAFAHFLTGKAQLGENHLNNLKKTQAESRVTDMLSKKSLMMNSDIKVKKRFIKKLKRHMTNANLMIHPEIKEKKAENESG